MNPLALWPSLSLLHLCRSVWHLHPHHAYLFANRRANRMKVLVHDGIGIWLAARRLNQGRFVWPPHGLGHQVALTHEQLQALVIGLPWQRMGEGGVIRVV